jgi:hypothetical protein
MKNLIKQLVDTAALVDTAWDQFLAKKDQISKNNLRFFVSHLNNEMHKIKSVTEIICSGSVKCDERPRRETEVVN